MQSAFLIVAKGYTEKQVGVLFFVFGMSQFLFQAPAGYLFDYTEQKILWLSTAGVLTTILTCVTAFFASEHNFWLMVFVKFLQGAITSFIPPGLNSITQGIVGAVGMTEQVSINEMMNHLGTAIIVLTGSLIAFALYPHMGVLFIVSPIACTGFVWWLNKIRPEDIDHDAARGLKAEATASSNNNNNNKFSSSPSKGKFSSSPSSKGKFSSSPSKGKYTPPTSPSRSAGSPATKTLFNQPSFVFGVDTGESMTGDGTTGLRANTPLQILRDPILLIFILVCFLFHTANGTILPLVMQTLAIGNGRSGILLSGLCITVAQIFMVASAKICGAYSGLKGRKGLFLIGLSSVPIRCAILALLLTIGGEEQSPFIQFLILMTQILDGVGAGTFGTMYILVTSDISGGTGRFGLTLGLTTAAMSIGGTVSGYMGQALAEDRGYRSAFLILMVMSTVPALLYFFCMPETLPEHPRNDEIACITEEDEDDTNATHDTENNAPTKARSNYMEMA
jgi:MFS family permease